MFKKMLSLLFVLVMVVSLASCAKPAEEAKTETTKKAEESQKQEETQNETEAQTQAPSDEPFIVGVVTDIGGIDDKSFNQSTWEGVQKFAADMGVESKYIQSETDADYIPNLSTFSDEELNLIVSPGFLFTEALTEVAANFPDQKYLLIDSVVDAPNVASAVFAENEGSYLVGIAAGLKAKEAGQTKVGYIGGMDFDIIQKFEAGFEAGVKAVAPDVEVLVEYAGSFTDTQIGQTLAAKMYSQGAYVIYHAAGATGNGLIKEAKDRRINGEDVWACGVDKDQYADGIYDGENSVVLTSMMKRVDVAAYDVAKAVYEGTFPGGQVSVFSLANNGVGIPEENPNLSDEIVAEINAYKEKILAGEIEVPVTPSRIQ